MGTDDSSAVNADVYRAMADAFPFPTAILGYVPPITGQDADLQARPDAEYTSYEGWSIIWCNHTFEDISGFSQQTLRRLGMGALRGVGGGVQLPQLTNPELTAVDSTPLLFLQPSGQGRWLQAHFRRLPSQAPWAQLWMLVGREVPDPAASPDESSQALARVRAEVEQRAYVGLSLVARVSELLSSVPGESVLASISDLLARNIVPACQFMTLRRGQGLVSVDGFVPDRLDPRQVHSAPIISDPVVQLWLSDFTGTQELVLPADVPADSPSATVRRTFGAHPEQALRVLVSTASGGGSTPVILLSLIPDDDATAPAQAWSPEELCTVLDLISRRVCTVMEARELHHREHLLVEHLQRSMLPAHADAPGLDVWTYYQPFSEVAQVGGDWFDISPQEDGSTCVILGDTVGHDVESIAAMNQIRAVITSLTADDPSPDVLVREADQSVRALRVSRTAALVAARFTPGPHPAAPWTLCYTLAGHLPGIAVTGGQARILPGAASGLLGIPTGERTCTELTLHPGDAVVFFTDGLVERRGAGKRRALEAACQVLSASSAPDAAGIGEEIMGFAEEAEDDVSVVVVRIPGGRNTGPGSRGRRWQLLGDPSAALQARETTSRALTQWGIKNQEPVLLVVSELVSNAVMHGWGWIGLRVREADDAIRVEVEDANPTPPRLRHSDDAAGAQRPGGFGLHVVSRLAEWGWRPTGAGKVVWARVAVGREASPL